ncbi:alanyl aminopeptidase. Metallo peptidase. MEROPS family M01 [Epsilonproteobacteria bacterium SCGC AD-311-C15]|jgi:aminopeptidase N|nr:alanyl aminopeptidase. Metallo peptidase. MEROPS family M01 [Epsilonproteobacteria bacterium SCGC AD-311-C15]
MNEVKTIYLKDYKAPEFKMISCDLEFDLFEDYTIVANVMKLQKIDESVNDIVLDSMNLNLLELWLNDLKLKDTRYITNDESLRILNVPKEFTLKIVNKIFPHTNTELEGLYKSGSIFCTQNEPEGFRKITPYLDRPDVMSVFTTTVIADKKKYPILLSNGNKKSAQDLDGYRHSVTWEDPFPKPSYLFALVAGDLGSVSDEYTTASNEHVELNIYCDLGNESKCHHAMKSLKEAMVWDEEKYGREYDLEIYNIVAVDSFNMGAMENKGLNVFNSHYVLADKEVATDNDFMGIQSVIAHEYFHNWTGNRITCRDWFQLTLKEGLTVFRDQCFSADLNSKNVQRIQEVKSLRERQFVEDASPTSHPIQPKSYMSMNNFYTATVYEKGAEVIRMIHTLIGEEAYRKATDLYFERFDGQAVTTDDFLSVISEASGVDLKQFKRWYDQSGTPKIKVEEKFHNEVYTIVLTQVIPHAVDGSEQKPYYFPLKVGLIGIDGKEILEKVLVLSKEREEFIFEEVKSKPYLSLNRDFSAPIIIEQKETEYSFLMKHDTNSFVRYESAQSFAVETLEEIMLDGYISSKFIEAYGYILSLDIDLSYKALLLELPSVSTLMQRQEEVDFEPIYLAKDRLEKKLAQTYKEELLELYNLNHVPINTDIDSHSMAKRSMKNRCLKLLSALGSDDIIQIVKKQYKDSLTMTDKIAALDILENIDVESSEIAMADFYKKYKKDTLVMNKYFSILAASSRTGTLERVIKLQNDEVYDEKVPNLVRSLIGVFARNYKYFHSKDAEGYKFVADKIIEIDKINAQMASGLAGAFKIYARLNHINKELMKVQLERIISTHSLSKNVYEIVSKILKIEQ